MAASSPALLTTALSIGIVHTLLGPDHYIPFVALARSRRWSLAKTLGVTAGCGVGHVLGSILLGLVGIALGWAVGDLAGIESWRGDLAGWLLLGFGLAYTAWGVRHALRQRPHEHAHTHASGVVHSHTHDHLGEHAHPHAHPLAGHGNYEIRLFGPWTLFILFVLGPCEPLIPLLMLPASQSSWSGVGAVALVFALGTIATMLAVVSLGALGLAQLPAGAAERWSHALAGLALAACGAAVQLGL